MKTNFFKLFIALTISVAVTANAQAQVFAANMRSNIQSLAAYAEEFKDVSTTGEEKAAKAAAKLTRANLKALNGFKREFKDGPDVRWTNEKEAISANFKRDGIQTFVVYDTKGNWIRSMNCYSEDKMPRDVRETIKRSRFYDYRITGVQDIKEQDLQVYIVHLENDKNYKQLCVYNGDYQVIKEYKKQVQ